MPFRSLFQRPRPATLVWARGRQASPATRRRLEQEQPVDWFALQVGVADIVSLQLQPISQDAKLSNKFSASRSEVELYIGTAVASSKSPHTTIRDFTSSGTPGPPRRRLNTQSRSIVVFDVCGLSWLSSHAWLCINRGRPAHTAGRPLPHVATARGRTSRDDRTVGASLAYRGAKVQRKIGPCCSAHILNCRHSGGWHRVNAVLLTVERLEAAIPDVGRNIRSGLGLLASCDPSAESIGPRPSSPATSQ